MAKCFTLFDRNLCWLAIWQNIAESHVYLAHICNTAHLQQQTSAARLTAQTNNTSRSFLGYWELLQIKENHTIVQLIYQYNLFSSAHERIQRFLNNFKICLFLCFIPGIVCFFKAHYPWVIQIYLVLHWGSRKELGKLFFSRWNPPHKCFSFVKLLCNWSFNFLPWPRSEWPAMTIKHAFCHGQDQALTQGENKLPHD